MAVKPKIVLLFLCVPCVYTLFERFTPIVELNQGKLRGIRSINGPNQYFGIPYGASERFQPPDPPANWTGIFDAVTQFGSCAQAMGIIQIGKEDCLTLDIYSPEYSKKDQKVPVLVFFHGGGYFAGAKWQYDPEFLVKKDIIVVIPNSRLGVLGFLCLHNTSNLGLKDQVAALKWIQKNIAAFGGDPDNVTISGQSAGSALASMHLLSKQSRGLFHRAILMSGVALAPWTFNVDNLTPALQDAAKIRTVRKPVDVYNTFLNATLEDLLSATYDTVTDPKYFKYAPCDDANFSNPFFHDTPYNTIKSGDFNKVPLMIGFTNLEGVFLYSLNNPKTLEYLDDTFAERLPSVFSWCSDKDKRKIASKLRSYYFGKARINSRASIKGGINMYSDWLAYASVDAFSKLMAKYSDRPVYNYMFTYEGERSFIKALIDRKFELQGASHIDDLFYLFKPGGVTLGVNDLDKLMIERFTMMVANFMKFGDPTPSASELLPIRWPVTTANRSQVMRLDNPLSVSDMPEQVRGDFYRSLLCEYGLSGYVPCDSAMQCNLMT